MNFVKKSILAFALYFTFYAAIGAGLSLLMEAVCLDFASLNDYIWFCLVFGCAMASYETWRLRRAERRDFR